MQQALFIVALLGFALLFSPVRRVLLHASVRRFLRIVVMTTCIFLFFGLLSFVGWYWWTVVRPAVPRTGWTDTTIEEEVNPATPHANGETITPTRAE